MKAGLLKPPSYEDVARVLQAWRLWLLGALVGATLAGIACITFPPPFRAEATVLVDHNLEEAWPEETDRRLFYYLGRETRKLEALAWADATLQEVSAQTGLPVSDLREAKLLLSQPSDGPWHFWAEDADAEKAAQLAVAWAEAFVNQTHQGVGIAIQISAMQSALISGDCQCDATALQETIIDLEEQSFGLSPYLQVGLSQDDEIPVNRSVGLGAYLFLGSLSGVALVVLATLFVGGSWRKDENA